MDPNRCCGKTKRVRQKELRDWSEGGGGRIPASARPASVHASASTHEHSGSVRVCSSGSSRSWLRTVRAFRAPATAPPPCHSRRRRLPSALAIRIRHEHAFGRPSSTFSPSARHERSGRRARARDRSARRGGFRRSGQAGSRPLLAIQARNVVRGRRDACDGERTGAAAREAHKIGMLQPFADQQYGAFE